MPEEGWLSRNRLPHVASVQWISGSQPAIDPNSARLLVLYGLTLTDGKLKGTATDPT
jgi:hypothetical protein